MEVNMNIAKFHTPRHRQAVARFALLSALALFAAGCAGVANLPQGVEGATVALPAAQASDDKLAPLLHDAVEVEALLPLEPKAAGVEAAMTTPGRPPGAIITELALAELSDEELDDMRGGFVFGAGIVLAFTVNFVATVNGDVLPPLDIPIGVPGIMTMVVDGVATVIGRDDFTGIISLVQNSLDFQDIRSATIVHANIYGVMNSVHGSLIRSQLNFGAAAGL